MATAQGGLIGTGMVPAGSVGNELGAITRRAVIPHVIVQIYQSTPTLNILLRAAQFAKGGVGNITVPVQGASFVAAEWIDFGGNFTQPQDQTAIVDAAANLTVLAVPISFMGLESLIQSSEVIVPRLKVKMADIKNVAVQSLSTALFAFSLNPLVMSGLPNAYDDGTGGSTVYANIDRSQAANAYWKGQLKTSAGAILTRSAMLTQIVATGTTPQSASGVPLSGGGEAPDIVIMSPPDWTALMTEFMTVEQFNTLPGEQFGRDSAPNAGWRALRLGDTTIVADLYCPVGTIYMINSKYMALYLSQDAAFIFSGFYSAIPNLQVANIGLMLCALQTLCVKPISGRRITGVSGAAF